MNDDPFDVLTRIAERARVAPDRIGAGVQQTPERSRPRDGSRAAFWPAAGRFGGAHADRPPGGRP